MDKKGGQMEVGNFVRNQSSDLKMSNLGWSKRQMQKRRRLVCWKRS